MTATILHLEDSDLDAEFIHRRCSKGGFEGRFVHARDRTDYIEQLTTLEPLDLILSDYHLPTIQGNEALELAKRHRPLVPFMFVSGALGEEIAVETLKLGAVDYVLKQRLERLVPAIERALAEARERAERVRIEQALRQSDERLRLVLEYMPVLLDAFDEHWNIVAWNKECERVTGYSAGEIVGNERALERLYPDPEYRRKMIRDWEERGHDYRDWAWEMTCKDGSIKTVSWSNVSARLPVPGWASWGVGVDITDRKKAEVAVNESNRRKDEFLAVLAHELRNPLAPIRNGLHVLKLAENDRILTSQARDMMERQLTIMVRLIDDLLDVNRISRGKIELRKERVDLARVVALAVETSRPLIEAGGHRLTIDLPPMPLCVHADVTRLAQVFSNLLNNAAKYTERCGEILISVEKQGESAVAQVRDSGIGIPTQMLPRVFDMFTQVDKSLERSKGGLGIGLSLVKALVEMHGGTVEALSNGHGAGSAFVVQLPLASVDGDGHSA